jgi:hypothetical protein
MENHLGRLLTSDEVVHHKDKNKHNNTIANLQLLSNEEHSAIHSKDNEATPITLVCPACNGVFSGTKSSVGFKLKHGKTPCCSRKCARSLHTVGIPKSSDIIEAIRNLHANGGSSYSIAKELGIGRNTVMKYW